MGSPGMLKNNDLDLSPGARDALQAWLDHLRALEDAAVATVEAYRADVTGFLTFLSAHLGGPQGRAALAGVGLKEMRAWMAHERGRGTGARSLARSSLRGEEFLPLARRPRRVRRHPGALDPQPPFSPQAPPPARARTPPAR